jgi:Beta-lactamase enzyme family
MAGGGRAATGVAVVAAVALALSVAACGHRGGSADGAGTLPAAGGRAASGAGASAAPHASPFASVTEYLAGRQGTVLAAVYDVATGQTWRLGTGAAQDEASVVKLDILEALLARGGNGGLPATQSTLARSMIEDSDNDAATSLWDAAGGATGLTAYNVRAGLTGTVPSPCVTCAGFPWPGWGLTSTVPDDQLTLLKQLVVPGTSPLLSLTERAYALSLLENVIPGQAWGVSGGVPAGVQVALKNGWLPLNEGGTDWQINSVGWVCGDGRDYLIAVLSTGSPTEQYGIDTVSGLSAHVWTALG